MSPKTKANRAQDALDWLEKGARVLCVDDGANPGLSVGMTGTVTDTTANGPHGMRVVRWDDGTSGNYGARRLRRLP